MPPPLISEYKKTFAFKRLLQSLFGGPKIFRHPVLILLQLIFFFIPDFLLTSTNYVVGQEDAVLKAIVSGISLVLVSNFVNFLISLLKRDGGGVKPSESTNNFLEEEDQEEYEGLWKYSTWNYVAPNAKLEISQIAIVVFTDACIAVASPLLFIKKYHLVLRAFGMFTICTTHYSAVIHVPPEIATFDSGKRAALMLTRPLYVLFTGIGFWLAQMTSEEEGEIFCIILAVLPLLWVIGLLPPADALVPWLLETITRIFGATPSIYYFGTVLTLIIGLVVTVLTYVAANQHRIILVPLQCVFAYCMICDIGALLNLRSSLCEDVPAKIALLRLVKPALIIWTSVTLIFISVMIEVKVNLREGMIAAVIILGITSYLLRRILIVQKHSVPKALTLIHTVWDGTLSYVLHLWIAMELREEERHFEGAGHHASFTQLVEYMLAIRGFASAITEPKMAAVDLSITSFILNTIENEEPTEPARRFPFVFALLISCLLRQRFVRLVGLLKSIVIIFYSFVSTNLIEKKWKYLGVVGATLPISVASLLVASSMEGASLLPLFTLPLFIVGFPRPASFWKRTWFPSNLSAKSITGNAVDGKSLDWTIYAQLAPLFARNFVRKAHRHRYRFEEGQSFLARYEDRLVFARVVSVGWNFVYLDVKGLEMQEQTSCHHQEAAAVDEILDAAFGPSKTCSCKGKLSYRLFGTLQPMMPLFVPSYSESKSTVQSLSSRNDIEIFRGMFFRSFSYLWIKKNPIFQGESYKRPVASGFNFGPNRSLDYDSDDDDFTPPLRPRVSFQNEFSMNRALQNFAMVNVDALPGIANGHEHQLSILPPVQSSIAANEPAPWSGRNNQFLFPHLPGMDENAVMNHSNGAWTGSRLSLNTDLPASIRNDRGDVPGLNPFWVRKCVGETMPSNAIKNRVEKLCWKAWRAIIGKDEEIVEIDLSQFFEGDFHKKARQLMRMSAFGHFSMEDTTLRAFRYATKLTLDEIFLGESFIEESDAKEEEIFSQLMVYEKSHKFCPPQEISTHIDDNQKHIFSMRRLEHGASEIKMLNYIPTGVEFRVGQLNKYSLNGIWANLNLELLYLTSDDDERLSIQNDAYLLRNICTQCADPPLGYPVYDATFKVNIFDKTVQIIT